jgi:hypothetical protein
LSTDLDSADHVGELRPELAHLVDKVRLTDAASSSTPAPSAAPGATPPPQGTAAAPASAAGPTISVADQVAEWREVIDFAVEELIASYPELAKVYTDDRRARLAQRVQAVAAKYGWFSAWGWLDKWGAEIMLFMAARPLYVETMRVINAGKAPPGRTIDGRTTDEPVRTNETTISGATRPGEAGTLRPNG